MKTEIAELAEGMPGVIVGLCALPLRNIPLMVARHHNDMLTGGAVIDVKSEIIAATAATLDEVLVDALSSPSATLLRVLQLSEASLTTADLVAILAHLDSVGDSAALTTDVLSKLSALTACRIVKQGKESWKLRREAVEALHDASRTPAVDAGMRVRVLTSFAARFVPVLVESAQLFNSSLLLSGLSVFDDNHDALMRLLRYKMSF